MRQQLAIQTTLSFDTIECYRCGVVFAIPTDLNRNFHRTKNNFYCPNGHSQAYTEGTVERLQRELNEKTRLLVWEQERVASLEKQIQREKHASGRLKRRISVGVCPCCHRTVSQLARHMQTKHPEYGAEQVKTDVQ